MEQYHTELSFQLSNLRADQGLRPIEFFHSLPEAAMLRNQHEDDKGFAFTVMAVRTMAQKVFPAAPPRVLTLSVPRKMVALFGHDLKQSRLPGLRYRYRFIDSRQDVAGLAHACGTTCPGPSDFAVIATKCQRVEPGGGFQARSSRHHPLLKTMVRIQSGSDRCFKVHPDHPDGCIAHES